jgi:hypothetical protein
MKRTRKKHNGATSVFEGGNTAAEGTASEATTRGCRYRSEEDLGRLPVDCGLRYRQRPYCPRAHALLRSRDCAFWQALAIARDFAGRGDP